MDIFDYSEFPTLTTERLRLRELQLEDAPDVFVFRADPEVQKFNDEPMLEVVEAKSMIKALRDEYYAERRLIWGITLRDEDKVIGLCGYNYWNRYHRRADMGYDLAQAYWKQGIGSEAMRAIINFGFERMNLHRIEAETIIDNTPSVRMLKRLGFQLEGVRRDYSWEDDGKFHGSGVFGLLRHEFKA